MILDRRPPTAVTPIQDHPNWPGEAAMNDRRFACPGPGANETPARTHGRPDAPATRDRAVR